MSQEIVSIKFILQDAEPERFSCYVQKYGPFVFACMLVGGEGCKEGHAAIHATAGKLSGNFRQSGSFDRQYAGGLQCNVSF